MLHGWYMVGKRSIFIRIHVNPVRLDLLWSAMKFKAAHRRTTSVSGKRPLTARSSRQKTDEPREI